MLAKRRDLRVAKVSHDRSAAYHLVESVKRSRHDAQLTVDARVFQALRIRNILVVKQVGAAHADPCGGQARQVLSARGDGTGGNVCSLVARAQVGAPTKCIASTTPHDRLWSGMPCAGSSVIQHRVTQQLKHGADFLAIPSPLRDRRGEPSPCARATDADAARVHAELISM